MNGHEQEPADRDFEDLLKRRRPLFHRDLDDGLEPPPELDRVVLRQARDAIETDRPLRLFRMSQWAAPAAIAATLVIGLGLVFKAGMTERRIPEVTVESAAQRQATPQQAPEEALAGADQAPWRRDARSWQAEIQRLRASGDRDRADVEQAEFNRQQRAYAASPDR